MRNLLSYVRWKNNGFKDAIRAEAFSTMAKINFLITLKLCILFAILYALPSAVIVHRASLRDPYEASFGFSITIFIGILLLIILALSVFIGVFELWAFRRRGFDVGVNLRMSNCEEKNFKNIIAAVGLVVYIIFIQPIIIIEILTLFVRLILFIISNYF